MSPRRTGRRRPRPVIPIPPIPPNVQTMESFRQRVSDGTGNVGNVASLFVLDSAAYPNVGLTTGGPQFQFQSGIRILFKALFDSFPSLVFKYPSLPSTHVGEWQYHSRRSDP